jgi:chorismate-pyruvate lyase
MKSIRVEGLDLVQRVMLASDGTLTDVLEAAFSEPIEVARLSMQVCEAKSACMMVDPDHWQPTIERKVVLKGATSGTTYVYAESWIAINRLPEPLGSTLYTSGAPIGRQWADCKLETRKELVAANKVRKSRASAYIQTDPDVEWLERAYRLFAGHQPIMLIKECFPCKYRLSRNAFIPELALAAK